MSKNNKRNWIILFFITILGIVGYNYINQDHRNISSERATYTTTSINLSTEFSQNSVASETKYLNKTLEISGIVTSIDNKTLTIDEVVFCIFTYPINQSIKRNTKITLKGRCIGYDDLLEQIKLDQCSII